MTVDMDKRQRWCDAWPIGSNWHGHPCEQSKQYYLHIRQWESRVTIFSRHGETITMPAGERDSEEGIWLCNDCAAQMCATHVLDRKITREIHVHPAFGTPYVEHRPFGVWKEYRP